MKIAHLSQSDIKGGAHIAAYRLYRALQESEIENQFFVKDKYTDNDSVISLNDPKKAFGIFRKWYKFLLNDRGLLRIYKHRDSSTWNPGLYSQCQGILQAEGIQSADLISLYWVCKGFLSIFTIRSLLKMGKPIVWRLSDMWPFTGGCHYSGKCTAYEDQCGQCPELGSGFERDLSRVGWWLKKRCWSSYKDSFTIVCPSNWIAQCASRSSLFKGMRIEVIHTGVDTNIFRPIDKVMAREILGLPQDRLLVLFGAMATKSKRKGGLYLKEAIKILKKKENLSCFESVVFGTWSFQYKAEMEGPVHVLGKFSNELSLPLIYSACDVFVSPSTEENLPNTVLEAMACGTPCVAFDVGGLPDVVTHLTDGYLARPLDVKDLAAGIEVVLSWVSSASTTGEVPKLVRKKIMDSFSMSDAVSKYVSLYRNLLK